MKTLKILYRDGTEIVIRPSEPETPKPDEGDVHAGEPAQPPGPKHDRGSTEKPRRPRRPSDSGLFPAFKGPIMKNFDPLEAMMQHTSQIKSLARSTQEKPLTFAVKHDQLDANTAREIFEQLPDGMHVMIVGDPNA